MAIPSQTGEVGRSTAAPGPSSFWGTRLPSRAQTSRVTPCAAVVGHRIGRPQRSGRERPCGFRAMRSHWPRSPNGLELQVLSRQTSDGGHAARPGAASRTANSWLIDKRAAVTKARLSCAPSPERTGGEFVRLDSRTRRGEWHGRRRHSRMRFRISPSRAISSPYFAQSPARWAASARS